MTKIDIDLNPTNILTIDAIGKPGERVFYLQGRSDEQIVTLLVEKIHVQTLALGIEQFLSELLQNFPNLPEALSDYQEENMRITPPVDPLFRVGDLSLGYDAELDLMVLIAHQDPRGIQDENEIGVVRFWCTRSQIVALAHWGIEVAGRGRPVWPSSGDPILPVDQFSPKNNGHKH
ncbi:MAG: DUF3090 family protein [Anaerolineaceae bacterium]|nr:DUF3090 family protein [Anaerolineaceae bacterium]